ncbi:lipoxygenase [Clonorchis sinensis]|uniref:Lipoxygenase n=1 Tax=Clonorchis sinensis TaxID=79923 RepID=G7YRY3_CLOSI|nr:lipoxygenase [Clonorchis sinensis]
MGGTSSKIAFEVCVVSSDYTGDQLGPDVSMVMFDHHGAQSPTITLDNIFKEEADYSQVKFTLDLEPWSRLKVLLDHAVCKLFTERFSGGCITLNFGVLHTHTRHRLGFWIESLFETVVLA